MTPLEYLESIKERLLTDHIVVAFTIIRERVTSTDVHIRARLELKNSSRLEFSEYAQSDANDNIQVITYSYHWSAVDGTLIQRWDNTPHHPSLSGFPHHIHQHAEENIKPGPPISIFAVLDIIKNTIQVPKQQGAQK